MPPLAAVRVAGQSYRQPAGQETRSSLRQPAGLDPPAPAPDPDPDPDPPAPAPATSTSHQHQPAGQDPLSLFRSRSRSASQLVKIRRQLAIFFVLGPQLIGSKNASQTPKIINFLSWPAVLQTLARAMFITNICTENSIMFHVKQCLIIKHKTGLLLTV